MTVNDPQIRVPDQVMAQWQQIADLLASVIGVPAALIMRANTEEIEVLVASKGQENPYEPGSSEVLADSGLYCETVIRTRETLIVPDALADPLWRNNPDVKLNMIAYLGLPLCWPDREPFGTLCVLDRQRNDYSTTARALMVQFCLIIEHHLELIHMNCVLGDQNKQLGDYLAELQTLRGLVRICAHCKCICDDEGQWHAVEHYLIRHPHADFSHGICPTCAAEHY